MSDEVRCRIEKMDNVTLKRLLYLLVIMASERRKIKEEYLAGFENVHPVEYYAMECLDGLLNDNRMRQ